MKRILGKVSFFLLPALLALSCGCERREKNNLSSDFSTDSLVDSLRQAGDSVSIERFDRMVAGFPSMPDSVRAAFYDGYAPVIDVMKALMRDDNRGRMLLTLSLSATMKAFGPDVESGFGETDSLERVLTLLKHNWGAQLPEIPFPARFFGVISSYYQSIVGTDSVMLIALNHYLGPDYEGYDGFPDYQKALKVKQRIPVDAATAWIYMKKPYVARRASTALGAMAYEGAVASAAVRLGVTSSIFDYLGYSPDQQEWVRENEPRIWKKLSDENMFFTTDSRIASLLVDASPGTKIINMAAPGRLGVYIGYKIVEAYKDRNPGTSIYRTLSPEFYTSDTLLPDAGYSPR